MLEDGIDRAWQQISEGSSISEAFKNIGIFPPLVVRMLRVGESSGQMDKSLNNVSYFFDRDINDSIDKLEPVLQTSLIITRSGPAQSWPFFLARIITQSEPPGIYYTSL